MILSHSGWNKENIYIDIYIKIYLYPVLCLWVASPLHTDTLDTQNLRLQTCHLWRPMSSKWRLRHMGSQASSAASGATLRSACLHGAFLKSAFWGSQITPFWTRKHLYIVWHTFCISLLKQLFWIHIASTHGGCHEARYHEKGVFPSAAGNESTSGPWVDLTFMYVHCMYLAASGNYIYIYLILREWESCFLRSWSLQSCFSYGVKRPPSQPLAKNEVMIGSLFNMFLSLKGFFNTIVNHQRLQKMLSIHVLSPILTPIDKCPRYGMPWKFARAVQCYPDACDMARVFGLDRWTSMTGLQTIEEIIL